MPIDIIAGEHQVSVKTEIGEGLGNMQVLEPSIHGELVLKSYTDGLQHGESVELENGQALHRVNRVVVSGLDGPINSDFPTQHGSIGLSFPLPQGTMDGYSIKLQEQSGTLFNGIFQPNVIQEHTTSNKVKVNSPYIHHISTGVGKYQDPIKIDGVNLHSCKILFKGYGSTNVEAPILSSGETFVNVSVPRNVIEGKITASGESGVYGTYSSTQAFYPPPTIVSMNTTEWVIGEEMQIEAINAAQMARTVAISGTHAQTDELGLFFVSNSAADQGANYHGRKNTS